MKARLVVAVPASASAWLTVSADHSRASESRASVDDAKAVVSAAAAVPSVGCDVTLLHATDPVHAVVCTELSANVMPSP